MTQPITRFHILSHETLFKVQDLSERTGLTEEAVIRVAVERMYSEQENDMSAIMVNESNGQYEIAPNAEPEDWQEVSSYGHVERQESLKGWGKYTAAYTVEQPPWQKSKVLRTQWYFVAE